MQFAFVVDYLLTSRGKLGRAYPSVIAPRDYDWFPIAHLSLPEFESKNYRPPREYDLSWAIFVMSLDSGESEIEEGVLTP